MQLTLTPEIERALEEHARRKGTTPERLALDALRDRFVMPTRAEKVPEEASLVDFLDAFIGVLHSAEYISGGAQMSEDSGRKFAQGMLEKRKQGRL